MRVTTLSRSLFKPLSRGYMAAVARKQVNIVEVGPRDGLQNEKQLISAHQKISLIERLAEAGLETIEAGSFVNPKWVPQMNSTFEILTSPELQSLASAKPALGFPVLVPNLKGFDSFAQVYATNPVSREIAVFISASEGFSKANLNCSIATSIERISPVIEKALSLGIKVRGYVSVVIACPFDGPTAPTKVEQVSKTLSDLGCYEISLGDTIGVGTPSAWTGLLEQVTQSVDMSKLAVHCHDTYGTAVSNVLHCVNLGIPTVDSSIAALGGCPYSPGATGNVATEDIVYALETSGISTGVLSPPQPGDSPSDLLNLDSARAKEFVKLAQVGEWISTELGRQNGSNAGPAALARKSRIEKEKGMLKL